jgi:hypothetical protein
MPVLIFKWKPKLNGINFYSPNPGTILPLGFIGSGSIVAQGSNTSELIPLQFSSELIFVAGSNDQTALIPISFTGTP